MLMPTCHATMTHPGQHHSWTKGTTNSKNSEKTWRLRHFKPLCASSPQKRKTTPPLCAECEIQKGPNFNQARVSNHKVQASNHKHAGRSFCLLFIGICVLEFVILMSWRRYLTDPLWLRLCSVRTQGMHNRLSLAIVLAGCLFCSPVMAGDGLHPFVGCGVPDCIGKWCCPDYCPKQPPCVCVPLDCCCDDYCPKRPPSVCVPLDCCCCDDYCRKRPPQACFPPLCRFLKCGPPSGCASCTGGGGCPNCETGHRQVRGDTEFTASREHAPKR